MKLLVLFCLVSRLAGAQEIYYRQTSPTVDINV